MMFVLTKEQCSRCIDTTEISIQRITLACTNWRYMLCIPYMIDEILRELIERAEQVRATEESFFLCSRSCHHSTSWNPATRHI